MMADTSLLLTRHSLCETRNAPSWHFVNLGIVTSLVHQNQQTF